MCAGTLQFSKKADIIATIDNWYKPTIKAITTIHSDALVKYPAFGWENIVTRACSSTIDCCKNAILRHLTLIGLGTYKDNESGYLHLDHVACRSHMFLTQYYRKVYKEVVDDKYELYLRSINDYFAMDKYKDVKKYATISPEFMLHMTKYSASDAITNTPDDYSQEINTFENNAYFTAVKSIHADRKLTTTENWCTIMTTMSRYLISELLNMEDIDVTIAKCKQDKHFNYCDYRLPVDDFMHDVSCILHALDTKCETI